MRKTRWLAVFFLPFLFVSYLHSQSLADLAKKEKERRAALKGKPATVITTADLAKVKKRPAVETVTQEQATQETAEAGAAEGQAQEGVVPPEGAQAAEAEAQAAAPAAPKPIETLPDLQNAAPSKEDTQAKLAELAKTAKEKLELADLLTLKMNQLYQEFYNVDSTKSRELLQAQISDTYDRLLKAQTEADTAVKDLEALRAQVKKEQTPSIWIK